MKPSIPQHPRNSQYRPRTKGKFLSVVLITVPLFLPLLLPESRGAPGEVDLSFDSSPLFSSNSWESVKSIMPLPGNQVLIGGLFDLVAGQPRTNLAKLNPDGSLDSSFLNGLTGPNGQVFALARDNSDRILVAGEFSTVNGISRANLARLNTNGTLDLSFLNAMSGPNYAVNAVALLQDGKMLIRGPFTEVNGVARPYFTQLNPDGSVDQGFATVFTRSGNQGYVSSFVVLPDGRLIVAGSFTAVNGIPCTNMARLHPNGSLDSTFVFGLVWTNEYSVSWVTRLSDGRIVCDGGTYLYTGGGSQYLVCLIHQLKPDGALDPSFKTPALQLAGGSVRSQLARQSGDFVLAGAFGRPHAPEPTGIFHFAPFKADGSYDSSFLNGLAGPGYSPIDSLAQQADGKIYIGGMFETFNGVARLRIVRLTGDYDPLHFVHEPESQTAEAGSFAVFHARAAGYPKPAYQWLFNGNPLTTLDETNSALYLQPVEFSQIGSYQVVAQNSLTSLTSSPVSLNVIAPVERRIVPGILLSASVGTDVHVECADPGRPGFNWSNLATVTLTGDSNYVFDLEMPKPAQRVYRAWHNQAGLPGARLALNLVPALTLQGTIGDTLRVDCISVQGPTNNWTPLQTVILTNSFQFYFDTSAPGQPARLYRVTAIP